MNTPEFENTEQAKPEMPLPDSPVPQPSPQPPLPPLPPPLANPAVSVPEPPTAASTGADAASRTPGILGVIPARPAKLDLGSIGTVEELSQEEYIALWTDEQILQDEFKNSLDAGAALADIRDRRLFRDEFAGFPEYYRTKWHFDRHKVHYLTATADVHKAITVGTDLPRPENAFQLRPLLKLKPDQARLAWEHAATKANGGKMTARLVRAAVVELKFIADSDPKKTEVRLARAERRLQLTEGMADLIELIVMRKSYEALIEKACLVDQHVRFFFPKRPQKKGK